MSDEGAAEKIVEAGLELWDPGGQPETLRAAAEAWKDLGGALDSFVVRMDSKVRATVGEDWRGDAADAFYEHWKLIKKSVEDAQSTFNDAHDGLKKAADDIEKINDQVHQIYIEIGVTVAISAGLSFFTFGFSTAAGAANAGRLAAQAANLVAKLGRLLSQAARWFNALKTGGAFAKSGYYLGRGGIIYGKEFGTGVATSTLSGNGPQWENNAISAGTASLGGVGAGALLNNRLGGGLAENITAGALGGASGTVAGDYANSAGPWADKEDQFDWSQSLIGAGASAAGGGFGGGADHHFSSGGSLNTDGGSSPGSSGDGVPGDGGGSGSGESSSSGSGEGDGGDGGNGEGETPADGRTEEQQHVDAAQGEAANRGAGIYAGVWGEVGKSQDQAVEGQESMAQQLKQDQQNTTLVNDFG